MYLCVCMGRGEGGGALPSLNYPASISGVTVATAIDGGDNVCVRVRRVESVFLAPHRIVYFEFLQFL